jgi:nucleotide-binding universal stress UspA family protein
MLGLQHTNQKGSIMYSHILVPIDGSDQSPLAIKAAAELAEAIDAKLTIFHAAQFQFEPIYAENTAFNVKHGAAFQQEAKRHAIEILENYAKLTSVKTDQHFVLSNYPATAIIDAAFKYDCDLIVMASHGHRGIKGLLLGSETHKVLTHSKIPVLVIR